MGIGALDLGGIDTSAAPGIARFKLGLGGTVIVLPGTWGR
jgi:lipid II:glycine glycyltransferase (peptidoglycan interpeptide bridge formation enzyme)